MTLLTDACTAYLAPLLKKHAADEPLVLEDLEASRVAAGAVLQTGGGNTFVSKKLDDLHQSQLQAYREAGTKALREWAQTEASLQPMEENDTSQSFVDRCVQAILATPSWPNWKVPTAKVVISVEIRKRARATFTKYHPVEAEASSAPTVADANKNKPNNEEVAAQVSNDEDNNVLDDGEDEDDEDEDGEMDDEDGEMEEEEDGEDEAQEGATAKPNTTNQTKKKNNKMNQGKKKKVVPRKKGTNTKQQTGGNRKGANARSRRGGRGGAAGAK